MVKQIFVNLPVKELSKAMKFFATLGFKFNKQFTDDNAACMIIGENIFSMLITHKRFRDFTKKQIADTGKSTEVLLALQVDTRKEVDDMVRKALSMGGSLANEVADYGWMYAHSFQDLDGHIWEVFYMDPKKRPKDSK